MPTRRNTEPGMRVRLARSAGFCFGVRRALRIAGETAAGSGGVCALGALVHNEDVLRDIERSGIRRIRRFSRAHRGMPLLICAHGAPARTLSKAREYGYRIVDATCPKVTAIHRIVARMEAEGRAIVVIGDRNHDEVRGIVGQTKRGAVVLDSHSRVPVRALRKLGKAAVVVQSTQNPVKVAGIVKKLKACMDDVEFHDTICRPTVMKQKEVQILARTNDVMIIIGSRSSANTRRLYELARAVNRNTRWVRSKGEIRASWLKQARSAGVGAGASTPDKITREVVAYLRACRTEK